MTIKHSMVLLTVWTWVFVVDRLDTATEVQFNVLLNETRIKRTQMSVLVVNTTHNHLHCRLN